MTKHFSGHVQVDGSRQETVLRVDDIALQGVTGAEAVHVVGDLIVEGELARVDGEVFGGADVVQELFGMLAVRVGAGTQVSQMRDDESTNYRIQICSYNHPFPII